MKPDAEAAPQALLLTVEEAGRLLGIKRTLMYRLVSSGEVKSVVVGRRLRRIPAEALNDYVNYLADTQNRHSAA